MLALEYRCAKTPCTERASRPLVCLGSQSRLKRQGSLSRRGNRPELWRKQPRPLGGLGHLGALVRPLYSRGHPLRPVKRCFSRGYITVRLRVAPDEEHTMHESFALESPSWTPTLGAERLLSNSTYLRCPHERLCVNHHWQCRFSIRHSTEHSLNIGQSGPRPANGIRWRGISITLPCICMYVTEVTVLSVVLQFHQRTSVVYTSFVPA